MFAHDRGWMHKMHEAVTTGLTAEAAVERVQSDNRARMMRQHDPYLRERLHDLDDLANRLMRQLMGRDHAPSREELPDNAILVARSMGPAALLDYDRKKLRALVLEEGGPTSHVSIVARALGIAAVGQIANATGIVDPGDAIIVDGTWARPCAPARRRREGLAGPRALRARRQAQYARCATSRASPRTAEGSRCCSMPACWSTCRISPRPARRHRVVPHRVQFMVAASLPRTAEQLSLYRQVLDAAEIARSRSARSTSAATRCCPICARRGENPRSATARSGSGSTGPGLRAPDPRAARCRGGGASCASCFPMVTTVAEFDRPRFVERGDPSQPPRPHAPGARPCRRHGRGAGAAVPAR